MAQKRPKYLKIIAIVSSVILVTLAWLGIMLSRRLKISVYALQSPIPSSFSIMQISDLHYPKNSITLTAVVQEVAKANPDFVVLTGDIIDGTASLEDMRYVCQSWKNTAQARPTFYILGNHEIGHQQLDKYITLLQENHLILLNNDLKTYHIHGNKVAIIGLNDGKRLNNDNVPALPAKDSCHYSVLLAHRPELFENYCQSSIDLVLTGHTHGGQARIFNQGLYAPNQGFFPKYSHGLYRDGNTVMLVNSGLSGNGRCYNPYEINSIVIAP